jgi:hypothetical protein
MWRLLRDELRRRAGGNAFRSGLAGMTLFMEEVLVSRFTGGRPRAGQGFGMGLGCDRLNRLKRGLACSVPHFLTERGSPCPL